MTTVAHYKCALPRDCATLAVCRTVIKVHSGRGGMPVFSSLPRQVFVVTSYQQPGSWRLWLASRHIESSASHRGVRVRDEALPQDARQEANVLQTWPRRDAPVQQQHMQGLGLEETIERPRSY